MEYRKQYDASRAAKAREGPTPKGDLRDGSVYVYDEEIELAVNVALATGRPLLVAGPPGSGKSSLAPNVARTAGWRLEEQVISSATEARDLMWTFDAVRRLRDAQAGADAHELRDYVKPEALWRAFDPVSAETRGVRRAEDPTGAVVLLDEIDKADPDVPNNLLVPLGSWEFDVPELGVKVQADMPPLVILTTNDERELSKPFVRRCVVLTLERPDALRLERIAAAHFPDGNAALHARMAEIVISLGSDGVAAATPSTAEYLDAIRACRELRIGPDHEDWQTAQRLVLSKHLDGGAGL